MAAVLSYPPTISRFPQSNSTSKLPYPRTHFALLQNPQILPNSKSSLSSHNFSHLGRSKISAARAKSDYFLEKIEKDESLLVSDAKPVKFLFWVVLWASVSIGLYAFSGEAKAVAVDSIRASGFGVKVANALRASGWPDEAVVFALATLPVIELRGAIPVGYWLELKPLMLTVLSVLGNGRNMVPVPFIVLYLKGFATSLTGKNETASQLLDMLLKSAKEKAGAVEEFQWLGLMLFVAVPFPGTGAWTGAIIASILDMPIWPAVSATFVGVVLAGLLVTLLVNLGLKYAIVTGIILFIISTFMWSFLRSLTKSLTTSN